MGVSPKATTIDEDLGLKATLGLADTAPSTLEPPVPVKSDPRINATLAATRTTVLPRRKNAEGAELHDEERPRFELVEMIGRGGMGEVALRLLPENKTGDAMLRFADEIRAVGQLEHPGIVPIYDVGLDDNGQHYLVMKHVQGETLETAIAQLKSGDPEYRARFTLLFGFIPVMCHISLTKKATYGFLHWVDAHPRGFTSVSFLSALGLLATVVWSIVSLVR